MKWRRATLKLTFEDGMYLSVFVDDEQAYRLARAWRAWRGARSTDDQIEALIAALEEDTDE